ncbi:OLC1v1021862C1 [Oldenlandia corymbosa var. corymbosa]|uniref:OLC1v1021862C1 n=1 Tax=Oldenlandia corymbosa var. corymbosa TaxID=529605 RepID=A0AAV1BYW7_OLDCO|nr:OLC1v1021862C1 [Oldenlandia corymbosa var. corymbosa]
MELISIICASFVFLLVLIKFLKKPTNDSTLKLPPGPKPLPIIGNMHNLFGPLTHHILRDLAQKYGPLMHLRLGEVTTLVVTSPELAEEFMKTHDVIFANRPQLLCPRVFNYNCTDIAFAPFGEYWRQLRKICVVELLSSKRVQSFRPIREEEVHKFVAGVYTNQGSVVNLSKMLCSYTYGLTARVAFGKKNKYQEEFISLIMEATKMTSGFAIADVYPSVKWIQVISEMSPKIKRMQKLLDKTFDNIFGEHKERSRQETVEGEAKEDLVDVLLSVQKSGDFGTPLSLDNIKAVLMDIFSAGSETSSTALEWILSELVKSPEAMKKTQEEVRTAFDASGNVHESGIHELKYLQLVIRETLRLHPPVPMLIPRESSEQCSINGFDIPEKTRVIINAWAISRDPEHWTYPDKFIPERFLDSAIDYQGKDFKYIPFGGGRRICPGISLGLASIELLLAQLLFHFDWKLPGGQKNEELDMTEVFGLSVRRKNGLNLIPVPYDNSSLVKQGQVS